MLNLNLFRRLWRRHTPQAPAIPTAPADAHRLLFGDRRAGRSYAADNSSTVLLIGNCIAEGMEKGLSSATGARSKFRFVAIPMHLKSLQERECLDLIAEAKHVFVQQLGGIDWPLITSHMSANATLFKYPSLIFKSLWPFDSSSGRPDELAQAVPQDKIRNFDSALAMLRKIEPDKKKRIARYRELNFAMADKIDVVAETQRRFHKEIDANSDCQLGRFIEQNYKDRQLFYNATHPSEVLFQELCEYGWRKLELWTPPPIFTDIDSWKDWSVPVHPGIARHLGVTWAHEGTRYRYCTLGDITWQDWVEAYMDTFG